MRHQGITLIVTILIPVFFQVVYRGIQVRKRHREVLERLGQLEAKLGK